VSLFSVCAMSHWITLEGENLSLERASAEAASTGNAHMKAGIEFPLHCP
jgi:hypothetical protein